MSRDALAGIEMCVPIGVGGLICLFLAGVMIGGILL